MVCRPPPRIAPGWAEPPSPPLRRANSTVRLQITGGLPSPLWLRTNAQRESHSTHSWCDTAFQRPAWHNTGSKPCPRRFHVHCPAGRPLFPACSVSWSRRALCFVAYFLSFVPISVFTGKVLSTSHPAGHCTFSFFSKTRNTKRNAQNLSLNPKTAPDGSTRFLDRRLPPPARTRLCSTAVNSSSPLLLLLH